MHISNRLSAPAAVLMLGIALTAVSGIGGAAAQDTLKIGMIAPFSGVGSAWGATNWQGAVLAVEEINADGGIEGRQIELIQGDGACVPATGVTAAQRLINRDEVKIITGGICSSVTLALMPVVEQAKVLLLNSQSSNPKITYQAGVGGYKYTFRNLATDQTRAAATVKYAVETLGRKKFGVLSVDSDFGRGAVKYVKEAALNYPDMELVTEDYFLPAETDFRPALTKIKDSGAEGIIYYGLVGTSPIICNQMHELGMGGGAFPLIGSGNFTQDVISKCPPGALQNSVETAAWVESLDIPASQSFTENYKKRWNGETPDSGSYQAWVTIYMLRDAIEAAGSTDVGALLKIFETGTFSTPMGNITFDDHHQSDMPQVIIEIVDDKRVERGTIRMKATYPEDQDN